MNDDDQFDAFLKGEGALARRLQSLEQPAPAAALDAAILARARAAISQERPPAANDAPPAAPARRQNAALRWYWKVPAGIAATVLVGVIARQSFEADKGVQEYDAGTVEAMMGQPAVAPSPNAADPAPATTAATPPPAAESAPAPAATVSSPAKTAAAPVPATAAGAPAPPLAAPVPPRAEPLARVRAPAEIIEKRPVAAAKPSAPAGAESPLGRASAKPDHARAGAPSPAPVQREDLQEAAADKAQPVETRRPFEYAAAAPAPAAPAPAAPAPPAAPAAPAAQPDFRRADASAGAVRARPASSAEKSTYVVVTGSSIKRRPADALISTRPTAEATAMFERVEKLLAEGNQKAARAAWKELQRLYPDYPIPDATREKLDMPLP